MRERLSVFQNLTGDLETAEHVWNGISHAISRAGREDILKNPQILDLGGGMGKFSQFLNAEGINTISLDKENLEVDRTSNPVRANFYQMPFGDATFDIVSGRGINSDSTNPIDYSKLSGEIARVLKPRGVFSIFAVVPPSALELEKYFTRLGSPDDEFPTLWQKKVM